MNYNLKHFAQSGIFAFWASVTMVATLFATYFLIEPAISHGDESVDITVRAQITDETSFLVPPANVTMAGTLNGVTGGQATGTTQFVVQTNNTAGYYVTIDFFDNGSAEAMQGDTSLSDAIHDYQGYTIGQPTYGYVASTSAQFAYTVTASSTSDLDQSFLNNGAACNLGGLQNGAVSCWMAPSTTAFRIMDTSAAAVTGATSTVTFNLTVPSGATPVPQAEWYTATVTLSVIAK
ncbi:hypothetical protein KC902_03605 [Candidatus Kaiserbacteria bacterium]|nr:hypothetical protein [Candidatus Kaiserbacteria bacterium]